MIARYAAMNLVPAFLLALSTVAASQPSADKPRMRVGDTWEFARSTTPSGKTDTWSRTVTSVEGNDRLRVRREDGSEQVHDDVMNFVPGGKAENLRLLADYPLVVGKTWPLSREYSNPNRSETGKARVTGVETVNVPAGAFQCYRVEAEMTLLGSAFSEYRIWTRWYCPEIKWIAKEVFEVRRNNKFNPADSHFAIETSELTKFTPGK
jgi:hypothetical protein